MKKDLLVGLYKRQAKVIYGYLIRHGCRKEEAEDIIQDSFIKAIEYSSGVKPDKFSSWLFMVALNQYRNEWKKKQRRTILTIDEERFVSTIALEEDFFEELEIKEKQTNVKDCLEEMKSGNRDLLILKYDMELSYKDISTLLGVSLDHVKTYLYRARNEFKKIWREKYGGKGTV